ncbi:MAG: hypothetical protein ACYTG0_10665 [Planctomycetota bacterium]|jgi:hypothetical protein
MTTLETDSLAELIRRKLDCLAQVLELGRKQLALVEADRMSELLDVLAAKQRLLVELERIEKGLEPFRGQDPEVRPWRTPEARRACANQLRQCEALLGEIVRQERQSERELIRRRDEVAAQLQEAHRASQARGAYTAQAQPELSRLDLASEA